MTAPQKEHPHALQEYAITEHELFLYETNGFWDRTERRDISALIRSRPTPSPLQSCKYIAGELCVVCDDSTCKFYPLHNHDATIRNATLTELLAYINPDSRAGMVILEKIESIRKEQP
jgi:hypothetical protein